jgi:hypothetical protein
MDFETTDRPANLGRFLYLAVVLAAFSRIVGWSMAEHLLVTEGLNRPRKRIKR